MYEKSSWQESHDSKYFWKITATQMTNKFRLTDDAISDELEYISDIVQEGVLFKNIKCGYQRTDTKGQTRTTAFPWIRMKLFPVILQGNILNKRRSRQKKT